MISNSKNILRAAAVSLMAAAVVSCAVDRREAEMKERDRAFDLLTRAQELKQQGDLILARDLLLEAAELSERPVVYYEIANTYYRLEQPGLAIPYYEKALTLSPDYQLAQAELDLVQLERRHDEATTTVAQAAAAPVAPVEPVREEPREVASAPAAPAATPRPTPAPTEAQKVTEPEPTEAPEMVEPEATAAPEPAVVAEEPAMEEPEEVEVAVAETPAPTATPRPTPTPRPTRRAVAQATTEEPAATSAAPANRTQESQPSAERSAGVFGALSDTFNSMSGEEESEGPSVTAENARGVLFPELSSPEEFDAAGERDRAQTAQRSGRFDEASRRWLRIVRVNPDDIEARLAAAESLYRSGRTRRAQEEFNRARDIAPDNAEVYFERGNYYRRLGDLEAARTDYMRALDLDEGHVRARNNLGAVYLDMDPMQPQQAVMELQRAVELDPQFAAAWLNLALAQDAGGASAETVLDSLTRYLRISGSADERTEDWMMELQAKSAVNME